MRSFLHSIFVALAEMTAPKVEVKFPFQNDPRFPIMYQENGCNIHVTAWHCWQLGRFAVEDCFRIIYTVTERAMELGVIRPDYYINDYDKLYELFGVRAKYTGRHESPDRMCKKNEIEHLYWEATKPNGKVSGHFTAGDGHSNNAFDPWGESYTRMHGELVSKRIFELEEYHG